MRNEVSLTDRLLKFRLRTSPSDGLLGKASTTGISPLHFGFHSMALTDRRGCPRCSCRWKRQAKRGKLCRQGHAATSLPIRSLRASRRSIGGIAHPVPVVVWKLMVIMIAFAERYQGQQPRVARTAPGRIGLFADAMAERVDAEGAVLDSNHTGNTGDEERPKRRRPAAPHVTDHCRQRERDGRRRPIARASAGKATSPKSRPRRVGSIWPLPSMPVRDTASLATAGKTWSVS